MALTHLLETSVLTRLSNPVVAEATFANAAGAETIVTLDTGFALLPASQLAIYTDRSRLASCRKKRAR